MLVKYNNYVHIELSQYLLSIKNQTEYKDMILRNYVEFIEKTKGSTYLINILAKELVNQYNENENIVISGIRHIEEIIHIRKNIPNKRVISLYIVSSIFKRILRILKRNNRNSMRQFLIEEYYSIKWGDYKVKKQAIKISNNKTIEKTYGDISYYT